MTAAFIGLGSNLNDPPRQLQRAVTALGALPDSTVARVSSVYASAPVGPTDQPDYLNAVLLLETALPPAALLRALQDIEDAQGRERGERWGPRTLDLDLLLYGDLVLRDADLTLPHPHMHERDFVLYPLREISDTNLVLPDGSDIDSLAAACRGNRLARTDWKLRAR